eukprot:Clim_evm4s98 gene=Clim_evmTU4s98
MIDRLVYLIFKVTLAAASFIVGGMLASSNLYEERDEYSSTTEGVTSALVAVSLVGGFLALLLMPTFIYIDLRSSSAQKSSFLNGSTAVSVLWALLMLGVGAAFTGHFGNEKIHILIVPGTCTFIPNPAYYVPFFPGLNTDWTTDIPTDFVTEPGTELATDLPTSPTDLPTSPTNWPTSPTNWPTSPTDWPTDHSMTPSTITIFSGCSADNGLYIAVAVLSFLTGLIWICDAVCTEGYRRQCIASKEITINGSPIQGVQKMTLV